ncbi:MAG: carbohydrate binding domain-containing protein [Bacteroidales bacterium]|nr:carbohydrate binding domain-containing protein [Candidatus Liminaster caballi]
MSFKNYILTAVFAALTSSVFAQYVPVANADSAWLFTYSTLKNAGRNGLHFAWSMDKVNWQEIGPEWAPVKSDYGAWGAQKRMLDPVVWFDSESGLWKASWHLNEQEPNKVAITESRNLSLWKPQDYVGASEVKSAMRNVAPAETIVLPSSGEVKGQVHRVAWPLVNDLLNALQLQRQKDRDNAERAADDVKGRFRDLKPQQISVTVLPEHSKTITDKLIGIFFEDINYAADGGLYAELIQNRDFEYTPEHMHDASKWQPTSWWVAEGLDLKVSTDDPLHVNNPHYAVLSIDNPLLDPATKRLKSKQAAMGISTLEYHPTPQLANRGWEGIAVKEGARYDFSVYGRVPEGKSVKVKVQLQCGQNDKVIAESTVTIAGGKSWKKVQAVLKATASANDARLVLLPQSNGTMHLDMVSLFPQDTYKGRKNGMRRDLAEALEALHPKFVRFPGGCASHGDGLDNMYRWKNTIGPLESRKPNWNIWHYHQTVGIGYYEYFQFCEDLGAEPLPVLAAGVPCQNSSAGGNGQQGGIPMDQMPEYVQEVLDLIEWANGDPKTSEWARMRAEAGHPKPFGLKMIGIGNEDLISDVFTERYKMICEAVAKQHPEVEIVGTVGPFCEGSDYERGWELAHEMNLPYVDEHYYNSPGWFINNQTFYDRYARHITDSEGNVKPATRVYLGEYASHIGNRSNCVETALSEALYLCSVERNADIVAMTSYAPLLAKKGHTQWNPDMIYFTNTTVEPTSGYQVQKMFGQNAGTKYIASTVRLEHPSANVQKRVGCSVVVDEAKDQLIIKLVNYLPVENTYSVALPDGYTTVVAAQTLTGELADTHAVPADSEATTADGKLQLTMPAYSFTVVRIGR